MTIVTDAPARELALLREHLIAACNPDGGWGYYAGKASRLEPTCWALLALPDADPDVLRRWPHADGLLLERPEGTANYGFHGLALLTLLGRGAGHEAGNAALVGGLQRAKGVALPDRGVNRQDNTIQAWSWMAGTFSWVEPTTYCVLALKRARLAGLSVDASRIADGERLLFDRVGIGGGWNYGNSNMLGQELPSHVPTTALGLLALQDQPDHEAVRRSLAYLERDALSERSSLALGLSRLALRVHGRPVEPVERALRAQLETTRAVGNLHAAALALYALDEDHGDAAFTLR